MKNSKRLLIAMDNSEASQRAVDYVSVMIDGRSGYYVCVLHAIEPVPPFEHAGAEDPRQEAILDARLQKKDAEWLEREKQAAQPRLEKAKSELLRAQVSEDAIATRFAPAANVDGLVTEILAAAEKERCDAIVVGRETFTGLDRIFRRHVADDLIRRAHGYTIWIVE